MRPPRQLVTARTSPQLRSSGARFRGGSDGTAAGSRRQRQDKWLCVGSITGPALGGLLGRLRMGSGRSAAQAEDGEQRGGRVGRRWRRLGRGGGEAVEKKGREGEGTRHRCGRADAAASVAGRRRAPAADTATPGPSRVPPQAQPPPGPVPMPDRGRTTRRRCQGQPSPPPEPAGNRKKTTDPVASSADPAAAGEEERGRGRARRAAVARGPAVAASYRPWQQQEQ
ncbi:hypothetical protein C2845_PM01G34860 [Panicum miliaceum]|uniref:Uncharacterized protein n=1 Tax=Panicum miliaceum TaxID=4540 RepID=A0A3L6TPX3_PANMI|nr:hypothetical protein C2845_PM01G34860 [Panicum miliaceum]